MPSLRAGLAGLVLLLASLASVPAGAGPTCDATATVGAAPCVVDGEPVPSESVQCLAATLLPGCYVEVQDPGDHARISYDGAILMSPDGETQVHPEHACPPVAHVHGVRKHNPTQGGYVDASGHKAFAELHHCAGAEPWSGSLSAFQAPGGVTRALLSHDRVAFWWGDYTFHDTCVAFVLRDGSHVQACDKVYN